MTISMKQSQSLQLQLTQQLRLTPQLQQAIYLLQLTSLELQLKVEETLEKNPLLERADEEQQTDWHNNTNISTKELSAETSITAAEKLTNYDNSNNATTSSNDYIDQLQQVQTLHEQLQWQIELTHFIKTDKFIALTILDSLSEQGFLNNSIEEISSTVNQQLSDNDCVDSEDVLAVLHVVQQLEPLGIGSRNLQEYLLIQLQQQELTLINRKLQEIISKDIDLLASRNYQKIKRQYKLNENSLTAVLELLHHLQAYPTLHSKTSMSSNYIIPDVIVSKQSHGWQTQLNENTIPRLQINSIYANIINAGSAQQHATWRSYLQEARWFISSLESRHETLLKVTTCIVKHQQAFFEHGAKAMQPLILHNIAEATGLHESTVSRITNGKYLHSPRGSFELKYFFSSHVNTQSGGEVSAIAIQALIQELITKENKRHPYSDQKITNTLQQQHGINVARRTITKYRETLHIAASNERKCIN